MFFIAATLVLRAKTERQILPDRTGEKMNLKG
nr:MAG TPA: hypothetical protein [Caudoviricetes sp.]